MSFFPKHLQKIAIVILPLIFIIFSCTQPKSKLSQYGPVFENVMLTDEGAFRGFSFGDSLGMIEVKETGKPVEKDRDYLYYEYKLTTAGSFNIAYDFDERGVIRSHNRYQEGER